MNLIHKRIPNHPQTHSQSTFQCLISLRSPHFSFSPSPSSQCPPPQALAHSGPMTFRVMALCGGFAMIFQCVFGSLGKLLSFSPLKALIEVYCGIFGIITIILEMPIEKAKFLNR